MRSVLLSCALSCVALSGCAIVPGQRMDVNALSHDEHVRFVPITHDLVARGEAERHLPAELLGYTPTAYVIGAGDTLYVTVWDHPELTSPAGSQQQTVANGRLVGPDGTVFFPYVGAVKAEGMTVAQLRAALAERLKTYVVNPQVDVSIVQYGSQRVVLEGAFRRTDAQVLTSVPITLGEAIGSAGVDPAQADLAGLTLVRDGRTFAIDMDTVYGSSAQPVYLRPGDRIYLPFNETREVYVVGEVIRPGALAFRTSRMTLTQAIGRAGGLSPVTANADELYVIRGSRQLSTTPAEVFHLPARSPAAFALADGFRMEPGDVVFVGAAGVTKWNRVLSQLLPLSGFIYNASRVETDN
jgi:polysaccharide biosynthesis/export protein